MFDLTDHTGSHPPGRALPPRFGPRLSVGRTRWCIDAVGGDVVLIGICEDDAAIRRLLIQALTISGHEVLSAHDGGEALRLFGADSGVDVVVMDIGLPDSDGRDVT